MSYNIFKDELYRFEDYGTKKIKAAIGIDDGTIDSWDVTDPNFAKVLKLVTTDSGAASGGSGLSTTDATNLFNTLIDNKMVDNEADAKASANGHKIIDADVVVQVLGQISDLTTQLLAIKKTADAAATKVSLAALDNKVSTNTTMAQAAATKTALAAVKTTADAAVDPAGLKVVSDKLAAVTKTANAAVTPATLKNTTDRLTTTEGLANAAATKATVTALTTKVNGIDTMAKAAATKTALAAVKTTADAAATKTAVNANTGKITKNVTDIAANTAALAALAKP